MSIQENVKLIKQNIINSQNKSALASHDVTLICVSKYHSTDSAQEVYNAGIRHFAENRPEGLAEKQQALPADVIWHFIGNLQTRKVKKIINNIDYFHALDRISLAEEIQKRAEGTVKCFIEVNISGEESKHGISRETLAPFIKELSAYPAIEVVGLMTMAPQNVSHDQLHQYFNELRTLRDQIKASGYAHAPCHELSMGMSGDYQIAIEEGATFVRVGSAFFAGQEI